MIAESQWYFLLYHTPLPFINVEDRDVLKLSFASYVMPLNKELKQTEERKFIGCPSPGMLIIMKLRNNKLILKICLYSKLSISHNLASKCYAMVLKKNL